MLVVWLSRMTYLDVLFPFVVYNYNLLHFNYDTELFINYNLNLAIDLGLALMSVTKRLPYNICHVF